jgi:hypothetical protein
VLKETKAQKSNFINLLPKRLASDTPNACLGSSDAFRELTRHALHSYVNSFSVSVVNFDTRSAAANSLGKAPFCLKEFFK